MDWCLGYLVLGMCQGSGISSGAVDSGLAAGGFDTVCNYMFQFGVVLVLVLVWVPILVLCQI